MKKMTSLLLAVLMLAVLFAGCSPKSPVDLLPADNGGAQTSYESTSTGSPVSDSYTAFMNAKNAMSSKLMEGLSNNPETAFTALALLGVTTVDLALLPVSLFGLGQVSVEGGLRFFGATDVKYTENGNSYTVTYNITDQDGNVQKLVFSGTFDAAADALVCTGSTDGKEDIYSEYRKTSFGYVAQYYILNDDGTASVYMIAVDGDNGTIGINTASGKPASLTGGEGVDFPKSCAEWYSVNGTTITGKTSDGTELNFEYTPSETE